MFSRIYGYFEFQLQNGGSKPPPYGIVEQSWAAHFAIPPQDLLASKVGFAATKKEPFVA